MGLPEDSRREGYLCMWGRRAQQAETVWLPFYLLSAVGHKVEQRPESGRET